MSAHAPYNFIPLPDQVDRAVDNAQDLPAHNVYGAGDYKRSGYFDVMLTTESPLYIRGMLSETEAVRGDKNKASFFAWKSNQPIVPGSSLRGMLRHMLEIVSWGKLDRVSEQRLFYRSVDNTSLGKEYRRRMVAPDRQAKVEFGFLRHENDEWSIQKCEMKRIKREMIEREFITIHDGRAPNKTPKWSLQYQPVWVQAPHDHYLITDLSKDRRDTTGWSEGRLVLTGDVPKKKKEFVFLLPQDESASISVPNEMIERFHDSDQISNWQESAFPKDKPEPHARERDGMLRRQPPQPGEPIFFLREGGKLSFFGRAYMFRLPYLKSPKALIPPHLRRESVIDYADAMFGFVRASKTSNGEAQARAGRVTVGDATLIPNQGDVLDTLNPITPPILGSPKPTTFQHYLDQREGATRDDLKFYDSKDAQVRGHKLYWRQLLETTKGIAVEDIPADSKQYTRLHALKKGTTFTFRVHFDNLSDYELMLLAWTITLGSQERAHMLGMGKPFGMGVVNLTAKLVLVNREKRYKNLFSGTDWATGEGKVRDAVEIAKQFEAVLAQSNQSNPERQRRWKSITVMLRKREKSAKLSYMTLEEFKGRPILPEAVKVFGN